MAPDSMVYNRTIHQTSEGPYVSHIALASPVGIRVDGSPIRAQQHQHRRCERLGTVDLRRPFAAAKAPFNHGWPVALLRVRLRHHGFGDTLKADPACAHGHWGIAIARWTNPFSLSIRPAAQVQQGLEASAQARQAAAKNRAGARLHRSRRQALFRRADDGPAARVLAVRKGNGGARGRPTQGPRGLDFLGAVADRGGAAQRQDLRQSTQGGRDPREAVPGSA